MDGFFSHTQNNWSSIGKNGTNSNKRFFKWYRRRRRLIYNIMSQYSDIDFSFSRNSFTGDLNIIEDVRSIRQSIKNILLTFSGERSFKASFGAGLYKNLFESSSTIDLDLGGRIISMLNSYDSRIRVYGVTPKIENSVFTIDLKYEYRLDGGIVKDSTKIQINIEEL